MKTLYTIPFSHYNEKARWVLDRFGVAYKEKAYLPIFHFLPLYIARRGKGSADRVSSRFSTPLLITEDGVRIGDSSEIVKYISDGYGDATTCLYFDENAEELENYYHDRLGPHTRRVAYYYVFKNKDLFLQLARKNVGPIQAKLCGLFFNAIRKRIERPLRINSENVKKSINYIKKEFSAVEKTLTDGRLFLLGNRFSAADLSFACMAAPCLMISTAEGYGAVLPSLDDDIPEFVTLAKELRLTKTGQFVLRLFQEERNLTFGRNPSKKGTNLCVDSNQQSHL